MGKETVKDVVPNLKHYIYHRYVAIYRSERCCSSTTKLSVYERALPFKVYFLHLREATKVLQGFIGLIIKTGPRKTSGLGETTTVSLNVVNSLKNTQHSIKVCVFLFFKDRSMLKNATF